MTTKIEKILFTQFTPHGFTVYINDPGKQFTAVAASIHKYRDHIYTKVLKKDFQTSIYTSLKADIDSALILVDIKHEIKDSPRGRILDTVSEYQSDKIPGLSYYEHHIITIKKELIIK